MLVFHRKSPPEILANLKASSTTAQALYNSTEIHIGTSLELEYMGLGKATCVTGLLHDSGSHLTVPKAVCFDHNQGGFLIPATLPRPPLTGCKSQPLPQSPRGASLRSSG